MTLTLELDREVDGRWIAEIPQPNILLYAASKPDAFSTRNRPRGRMFSTGSPTVNSSFRDCRIRRCWMSTWPSAKARRVFAALKRIGWHHDRTGRFPQNREEERVGELPFSFHDSDELGPAILAKVSKKTGLKPGGL